MKKSELLAELKREQAMRARVYPRWVRVGKLRIEDMNYRNKCLEQLIDLLEKIGQAEIDTIQTRQLPSQGNLFG